jgi:hypothetical protein
MKPELRRKAPRRTFHGQVGVMYNGHMTITRCSQLGEGGVLIRRDELLDDVAVGDDMVVTLFLPNIGGVVARSKCVYLTDDVKMGLQFEMIDTKYKVRIREFVSRQKAISDQ